jgi:hypothetical protein
MKSKKGLELGEYAEMEEMLDSALQLLLISLIAAYKVHEFIMRFC